MRRVLLGALIGLAVAFGGPALAGGVYTYKTGQSLSEVAADIYGSAAYETLILKLNRIADKNAIANGTQLRVPDLKQMLLDEGLPKQTGRDLDDVMRARYLYVRHRQELLRTLSLPGAKVPEKIQAALKEAASSLEEAAKSLGKIGQHADSPSRMKDRLTLCAKNLRKLAAGSREAKLDDSIHRLFAQAFVRGLMWARKEDGN